MDVVKNILGSYANCPLCGEEMTDVGYWWCSNCGFESSYRELESGNWKDLDTTRKAYKRLKNV